MLLHWPYFSCQCLERVTSLSSQAFLVNRETDEGNPWRLNCRAWKQTFCFLYLQAMFMPDSCLVSKSAFPCKYFFLSHLVCKHSSCSSSSRSSINVLFNLDFFLNDQVRGIGPLPSFSILASFINSIFTKCLLHTKNSSRQSKKWNTEQAKIPAFM